MTIPVTEVPMPTEADCLRDEVADFNTVQAATPGPWRWNVNPKGKSIRLESQGGSTVMDFVRWGMQGAQPRFRQEWWMVDAAKMATPIPGRRHHEDWARELRHPDARFVEQAHDISSAYLRLFVATRQEIQKLQQRVWELEAAAAQSLDSSEALHVR
jgi:hypothetical protein